MADDGSFQERILKTLENIISSDSQLKSFTIIPEEINEKNISPILYVDHYIGLESWCVKHIYKYAHEDLLEIRHQLRKNRLPSFKAKSLNHLLIGVLLINPDVSTFWAMKRELVESDILTIENELLFSKLVLTHKGKSNETFSYRRWLLKRILDKTNEPAVLRLIYMSEMIVVEIAAENSANNYHAWTHRIWCAENILKKVPTITSANLYFQELHNSLKWVEKHVSEYTGYHYRQYLFKHFKEESENFYFESYLNDIVRQFGLINDNDPMSVLYYLLGKPKNCVLSVQRCNGWLNYFSLLLYELFVNIPKLNAVFPNHETQWYHRRFLLYHLVLGFYEYHNVRHNHLNDTNISITSCSPDKNIVNVSLSSLRNTGINDSGEKQPKIFKSQPLEIESSRLYEELIKNEQKFISDNSSSQQTQYEHIRRHVKWMNVILGFQKIS